MNISGNFTVKDLSNADEIIKVALDYAGNIVGQIKGKKEFKKNYASMKLPIFYANADLSSPIKTKPHIYVSDLFVPKEYRSQGIGKNLVFNMVKESQKQGFEGRLILLAGCNEQSPLPFYKKLGFLSCESSINKKIDECIRFHTPMDKNIQTFMSISKKAISKILKIIK